MPTANQPGIAHWNLTRLAEALLPLIDEDTDKPPSEQAKEAIQRFPDLFRRRTQRRRRGQAGVSRRLPTRPTAILPTTFFTAITEDKADFTLAFRFLAEGDQPRRSRQRRRRAV
jgi:uncharacterized protein YdiU (UPF0061 family)